MKSAVRIGQILMITGLILTVVGLIVGFWLLFQGGNDDWAIKALFAVPTGFMLLFTGLATSVMFSPSDERKLTKQRSLHDTDDLSEQSSSNKSEVE